MNGQREGRSVLFVFSRLLLWFEREERKKTKREWRMLENPPVPESATAVKRYAPPNQRFFHSIFLFFSLSFFSSISNCYYHFHFPAETVLPTDANHLVTPFINPNLFSFRLILLTTYLPMLNNPLVIYFFRFCTFAALFC